MMNMLHPCGNLREVFTQPFQAGKNWHRFKDQHGSVQHNSYCYFPQEGVWIPIDQCFPETIGAANIKTSESIAIV